MVPRTVAVALALAAGCGGKVGHRSDPAAVSGPGLAGIAACQGVVRLIDALVTCAPTPDEKELHRYMSKDDREALTSTAALRDPVAREAERCVERLEQYDAGLRWQRCPSPLTADERGWIDARYRRRTAIPAGADPTSQAALVQAIDVRDRACACKDVDSVEGVLLTYVAEAKRVPDDAPEALRRAHDDIMTEANRCEARLKLKEGFIGDPPASDPAAARRMLAELKARDARDAQGAP